MQYRNDIKIAFVFIAIGLMLGGVVALFQPTPPDAGDGWTEDNTHWSTYTVIIPDQTGDGINDIFMWVNPEILSQRDIEQNPEWERWNATSGFMILDGKTGNVRNVTRLQNESLYIPYAVEFKLTFNYPNTVLALVAPVESYYVHDQGTLDDLSDDYYEPIYSPEDFEIIQISLTSFRIQKRLNFVEADLELLENFHDEESTALQYYRPSLYYTTLPNMGIPGNSYIGNILIYKNTFSLKNDTGDGINNSKIQFTFINPNTLQILSNWNFERLFNYSIFDMWGFAEGPLNDTQAYQTYPYLYFVNYEHRNDLDAVPLYYNLISIDKLVNYSIPDENWLIQNESIGIVKPTELNRPNFGNFKTILNFHNKSTIISAVIYRSYRDYYNTSIDISKFANGAFPYFAQGNNQYTYINASRIDIIKFIDDRVVKSFSYESVINSGVDNGGIVGNNPLGPVVEVIPIANWRDNDYSSGVALVHSNQEFTLRSTEKQVVPTIDIVVSYLDMEITSQVPALTENYTIEEDAVQSQVITAATIFGEYYDTIRSTQFDLNNDSRTDIAFPGLLYKPELFSLSDEAYVTGPYFYCYKHGTEVNVSQTQFYRMEWLKKFYFRSDVSNDSIGDAILTNKICLFTEIDVKEDLNVIAKQLSFKETRTFFMIGCVMIVAGFVLLLKGLTIKNPESMKMGRNRKLLVLCVIPAILIVILYILLGGLQNSLSNSGTQIGVTEAYINMSNLMKVSGIASFVLFTALPASIGIWLLLAPKASDSIVGLNQIMYAKKAGLDATIKREEMKDTVKAAGVDYKILISPPIGRKISSVSLVFRAISVLSLSVSIGLAIFNNFANYFYGIDSLPAITSVTDKSFMVYTNAIFNLLIIPGIIAVPIFFWLIPTSWLLDDAGALFYLNTYKTRKPEDVESIGGWFSNYLKGFLGISAIVNYVQFIIKSPMVAALEFIEAEFATTIILFVFGFIILSGLAFGILLVIFHEIALPYSVIRLYNDLEQRKVDVSYVKMEFTHPGKVQPHDIIEGFTELTPIHFDSNKPEQNQTTFNPDADKPNFN